MNIQVFLYLLITSLILNFILLLIKMMVILFNKYYPLLRSKFIKIKAVCIYIIMTDIILMAALPLNYSSAILNEVYFHGQSPITHQPVEVMCFNIVYTLAKYPANGEYNLAERVTTVATIQSPIPLGIQEQRLYEITKRFTSKLPYNERDHESDGLKTGLEVLESIQDELPSGANPLDHLDPALTYNSLSLEEFSFLYSKLNLFTRIEESLLMDRSGFQACELISYLESSDLTSLQCGIVMIGLNFDLLYTFI